MFDLKKDSCTSYCHKNLVLQNTVLQDFVYDFIRKRKFYWCVVLENAVLFVKYLFQHVFLKLVQPILFCLLGNQKPTGHYFSVASWLMLVASPFSGQTWEFFRFFSACLPGLGFSAQAQMRHIIKKNFSAGGKDSLDMDNDFFFFIFGIEANISA